MASFRIISTTYNELPDGSLQLRNNFESKALFSIEEIKNEMISLGYNVDDLMEIRCFCLHSNGKVYNGVFSNCIIHSRIIQFN